MSRSSARAVRRRLRAERTGAEDGRGRERSLCAHVMTHVVWCISLYVDCCVSIADAPLDYVATLLVMTGLE